MWSHGLKWLKSTLSDLAYSVNAFDRLPEIMYEICNYGNVFSSFFSKMFFGSMVVMLVVLTACTENRVIKIYGIPGGKSRLKSRSLHIRNNLQVYGTSLLVAILISILNNQKRLHPQIVSKFGNGIVLRTCASRCAPFSALCLVALPNSK